MAIAAHWGNSLGLRADGSIVAWGAQIGLPIPNTGFVAIAVGRGHGLGLKVCYPDCNADGALTVADFGAVRGVPWAAVVLCPGPNAYAG